MNTDPNPAFGRTVTRLINREDLTAAEAEQAFTLILSDQVSAMHQGAFLAALTGKGETVAEVAGGWRAIYQLDTTKISLPCGDEAVDNCGTGMDSFKTFNISTAAAIVAAAGGVKMARHGARAITSIRGTVDMAESLGVDVECPADLVAKSIETCNLGLFNGMSPASHPMALGRILSQIRFGSPLNIAASLANPALPRIGVRGVYRPHLIRPIVEVMEAIGYQAALVVHGTIDGSEQGMDEASVCGPTLAAHLHQGSIREFSFTPEECGLRRHPADLLAPDKDHRQAACRMIALLAGADSGAQRDAVLLNAALIFMVRGLAASLAAGVTKAAELLDRGEALTTLDRWVASQHRRPAEGLRILADLKREALH